MAGKRQASLLAKATIGTAAVACMLLPSFSGAEPVPQNREVTIAKQRFLAESKKKAEEDWSKKQNILAKQKYLEEEQQILRDKQLVLKAEAKKKKLEQASIDIAKKELRLAQQSATESAKQIQKLSAKLKKEQEERRKANQAEERLGKATVYHIGSAGSSEVKSFEYHLKSNGASTFGADTDQRRLQEMAHTGRYGIRMVGNRYCAAIGSHYGKKVGLKFDVVFKKGNTIKCIMGDQKADAHTDRTNSYHLSDGSYVEFIVDRNALVRSAKLAGNVGVIKEMSGEIEKIIVYSK